MLHDSIKKHIKKLHQKKFRKEFHEFFVEGIKGVSEAINSGIEIPIIIIDNKRKDQLLIQKIIKQAEKEEIEVLYAYEKDIKEIKSTEVFPGVLAIVDRPDFNLDDFSFDNNIIALDGISDPGNLGTIIRTADWFGIENIIIGNGCVDPFNEKVVRSTMGSIFHVNIFESKNLAGTLETIKSEKKYNLIGLTLQGEEIAEKELKNSKQMFVFGSESHGISSEVEQLLDIQYKIKGKGKAESLNVAVAAGIVMGKIV
jgi:RNA methyltransferase, TrmH family